MTERSSRPIWLGADERKWDHVRIHVQLLADKRLGAYEIATYMGLVSHAELQTGKCYPAAETLAKYINASEKTVRRSVAVLVEAGYVKVRKYKGRANIYYVSSPPTLDSQTTLEGERNSTLDSGTDLPWTHSPRTLDSGTDEQEPITKTKNQTSEMGKEEQEETIAKVIAELALQAQEASRRAGNTIVSPPAHLLACKGKMELSHGNRVKSLVKGNPDLPWEQIVVFAGGSDPSDPTGEKAKERQRQERAAEVDEILRQAKEAREAEEERMKAVETNKARFGAETPGERRARRRRMRLASSDAEVKDVVETTSQGQFTEAEHQRDEAWNDKWGVPKEA